MAIQPFLAMTAAEIRDFSVFPAKIAWMACHFSPYGLGLSNLPRTLPPGSILMVDDITPPHRHDPELIAAQLIDCIETRSCCGVLLDFQRPGSEETKHIIHTLVNTLPCPVAVSELYAEDLCCPVFPAPVPLSVSLQDHLSPWKGREVWLDLALSGEVITVTEQGASSAPLPFPDLSAEGFADKTLHCHYHTALTEDAAQFTLWRTREDLEALMDEAENLGISCCVGLYQELRNQPVLSS